MTSRKSIAVFYYYIVDDNAIGRCNRIALERLCDKYDFTVFATRFDNPRPDRIRWVRLPSIERPVFLFYFLFRIIAWIALQIQSVARRRRFDLTVASDGCFGGAQLAHAHFCHRFYCRNVLRREDVDSARGVANALDHYIRAACEGRVYRRAPQVVVPSEGLRQELIAAYALKDKDVSVVANPIDISRYVQPPGERNRVRAQLGITDDHFICVFVALGHFERKGLRPLIQALADPALGCMRLLVVGGSASATLTYQKLAGTLGIENRITFCGHQTDTRPFLWAADAFVLPSRYETFSIVAAEAAASGIPVIATRLNGVEDWAQEGRTGFILRDSTMASIVESLKTMLQLPEDQRQQLGKNARAAVLRYDSSNYVRAFDLRYSHAISANGRASVAPALNQLP